MQFQMVALIKRCRLPFATENKAPSFNGQYYTYQKQKIKNFLEDSDIDLWGLVENGHNPPSKIKDGIKIFKP